MSKEATPTCLKIMTEFMLSSQDGRTAIKSTPLFFAAGRHPCCKTASYNHCQVKVIVELYNLHIILVTMQNTYISYILCSSNLARIKFGERVNLASSPGPFPA